MEQPWWVGGGLCVAFVSMSTSTLIEPEPGQQPLPLCPGLPVSLSTISLLNMKGGNKGF